MVVKILKAPPGGGSARGNIRYALGYELGPDKAHTRESCEMVLDESMQRRDLGVDVIWKPLAGQGIRPAGVYTHGIGSLATADIEMQGVAASNVRIKSPTVHLVFSFNETETATLTTEQKINAARATLGHSRVRMRDHQYVLSLHADTDNAHVHAVVGRVNPWTLKAWDTTRSKLRLSWAARETEIALGLQHEHGLAVVDMKIDGSKYVRWATRAELRAQKIATHEQRLQLAARRSLPDQAAFDSPEKYVERCGAEVVDYLREVDQRGGRWRAGDIHLIAARRSARIDPIDAKRIRLRLMRWLTKDEIAAKRSELIAADPALQKRAAFGESIEPVDHQEEVGHLTVPISDFLGLGSDGKRDPFAAQTFAFMRSLPSVEEAEAQFVDEVRHDVSLVSRELVENGLGVFTRDDIAHFIGQRVSDPFTVENLADLVETRDKTLHVLTADTEHPSYCTVRQLELQQRTMKSARELVRQRVPIDSAALEQAIARVETDCDITLTDEQRHLVYGIERRFSLANGDPGTGKTTAIRALQVYARSQGCRVVGLSLTELAARKLATEAKVQSMNIAQSLAREAAGKRVFRRGDIIVIDETSLTGYSQMDSLTTLCRERDCSIVAIGGKEQLPPIEAGFVHAALMEMTRTEGAFTQMTMVNRQRGELAFMSFDPKTGNKGLVHELTHAIGEHDRDGVSDAVNQLYDHGLLRPCDDHASVIEAAIDEFQDKIRAGATCRLVAHDKRDTPAHVTMRLRERLGIAGLGSSFSTAEHGVLELSVGDRIAFEKINRRLGNHGVANGDTGTVVGLAQDSQTGKWTVSTVLDSGELIDFDPNKYRHWTHGYCVTAHKALGSTVDYVVAIVDRTATAHLLLSMLTRARFGIKCFYSKGNFPSPQDLVTHIAARITRKPDAILLDEIIAQTGGPDTPWATRVRQAMADGNDPLRKRHLQFLAGQNHAFERERVAIFTNYKGLAANATLEERRRLRGLQTADLGKLRTRYPLLSFVRWTAQEHEDISREAMREQRMDDLRYRQRYQVEPKMKPDQTIREETVIKEPEFGYPRISQSGFHLG